MNDKSNSIIFRLRRKERGQVLPLVALCMVVLLGMTALVVDLGNAYVSYRQLQAATDAAALAGATVLPYSTAGAAIVNATTYSAVAGSKNVYPNLQNAGTTYPPVAMVTGYPQVKCLTTLTNLGIACAAPSGGNAIVVKQQATVPLYFASVLGLSSMNISTTSTASMRGAPNGPFNVVIIIDTTASMGSADGDASNCGSLSRLTCALNGVQVLLQDLSPCSANQATCGTATNGNVPNPLDVVSLMVFPPVTAASAPDAYCSGGSPSSISVVPYALAEGPSPPYAYPLPGGITPNTYQIVPFSSDYRTSDSAATLNPASNLVKAVGGASGCAGLDPKGGAGTYYAGVIYAAQEALTAKQAINPTYQNVIIILSDGNATASETLDFAQPTTGPPAVLAINGNGTGTLKNGLATYMSNIDECQQAIIAAKYAASQGTAVYSVSYGSEASGCTSDTTLLSIPGVTLTKPVTPCQTMQNIASDPTQFFSDYTGGGSSGNCVSAAQPTSNLNAIFGRIAADLTHARLIPDNTT